MYLEYANSGSAPHTYIPGCSLSMPQGILVAASLWIPGPACPQMLGGSLLPPERPSGTLAQTLLEVGKDRERKDV